MNPVISLQDIAVLYKRSGNIFKRGSYFEALKSVSLDIYPGETLGILGRNGSGKSTLLRVISGVIRPDRGKVINNGVSVSLLALQAGFDPNLSGRDNAILGGLLQGYARQEIEEHLDDILEYSELGDFFDEPVRTYSTGMSARLGFAISTIISPDVLLIDEVLGVGDKHFQEKAERTMVSKLQSQQTVVLVTHSHHQIIRLCDRAILLDNGISYASGDPHEVLEVYEERLEGMPSVARQSQKKRNMPGLSDDACRKIRLSIAKSGAGFTNLETGDVISTVITVTNDSSESIPSTGKHQVNVGYHWYKGNSKTRIYESPRQDIPGDIPAGESVEFPITIKLPEEQGNYRLVIGLVQEHIRWLEKCNPEHAFMIDVEIRGG